MIWIKNGVFEKLRLNCDVYYNDYELKNVYWVCLFGIKLNIFIKKYERDYMIMMGLFSKNFKGLLILKY